MISPFVFLLDPVLQAPTIACMLMCLGTSLMGVVIFLRKESLIGETLSHAAYPGLMCGVLGVALFGGEIEDVVLSVVMVLNAAVSALIGLWLTRLLQNRFSVPPDASLCFVLSAIFGIGTLLASTLQISYPALYKRGMSYLYGQVATMTTGYIWVYLVLSSLIIFVLALFYKEIQLNCFDRRYSKLIGIPVRLMDALIFGLVALSIMIGIRSVGIVLISAMLIAPAITARQYTDRLSSLFLLAGVFGMGSGFLGTYFSVVLSSRGSGAPFAFPTGPTIVLTAACVCLFSLLFAPKKGMVVRWWRIAKFRDRTAIENILKMLWKHENKSGLDFKMMKHDQGLSSFYLWFLLVRMKGEGWVELGQKGGYILTQDGETRAAKIVRLHRLWELYLVDALGMGVERVHRNAEEMEHIITPDLEEALLLLLNRPETDPHQQPIPYERGQ